jgi:hypothetical protein
MRNIKINEARLARELEANGYVVGSGIDAATVADLRNTVYQDIRSTCPDKVNYNTGFDLAGFDRGQTAERLKRAFAPVLDRYFDNHDCIASIMFVKRPSDLAMGQVPLHCDPTLLSDESQQRHLNIWVPLIDVDETNGALWVVPRAHKTFAPVHSFSVPSQFAGIADTVIAHGKSLRMAAGELLIFDNRMPHFSRQNFGAVDRPAVILSIVPSGAELISLFGGDGGEFPVEVYRQSHNWYDGDEWTNDLARPKTGEFLGHLNWVPRPVTRSQFIERIEGHDSVEYRFDLRTADRSATT